MRRVNVLLLAVLVTCLGLMAIAAASAGAEGLPYTPEAPTVDGVSGGPWNTSQGDSSAGSEYLSSDLFPTFTPGGAETTLGGFGEPNVAVYPGSSIPYPSGVAGTPGPLDGYCTSLGANPEKGSSAPQPAGTLPFSPYYFPDIVRNANGTLTGYFDYRPKDADEAITVALSEDGGKTWKTEGKALEQNQGYCPTADTNDDGQGHPYVANIGSSSKLYTLNRPAGDYEGVGLLVHEVEPEAADPLQDVPAGESVGIDPNTYAEAEAKVPTSGGTSIDVSTLGSAGSPEDIPNTTAKYEDTSAASPYRSIITCTGTSSSPVSLTSCTVAGSSTLTVKKGDDLVQVIATTKEAVSIPAGPNKASGEGGLAEFKIVNGNSVVSPLTTFMLNENAPNRLYIEGATVYCTQANANPTTKIEDCTNTGSSALAVASGAAITADPILPPHAQVTTGLKAPDGIVGTLPSYPTAKAGSTVVLYTQKLLAYFVVGTINGTVSGSTFTKGAVALPAGTINYTPSVHTSEPLPAGGSFKIYLGTAVGSPIQQVTCTGWTAATQGGVPSGSYNLTGCSGGTGTAAEGNWIGGPGAAIAPYSALEQIGEGTDSSKKGPEKLFGNNEDYSVLRAAETTNGIEFTDLGPISGSTSGTGNDSGAYNDLSNPFQQTSPNPSSPTDLAPGEADTTELRYIGSRGTIITNPNGSYGLFLSGSWATDGDSDAFNQIFYSSSANGREWSVPRVVLSTDYTFSASATQDEQLAKGQDAPLGVSAYYSGRAYGPAVVQSPGGGLTMVFSGYRLPKPITSDGTVLGTGATKYTVGAKDPALYRNILTMHLGLSTSAALGSSNSGSGLVGEQVTYTATLTPAQSGTGHPTGTVAFSDAEGPIAGCSARPLSDSLPDTAECTTTVMRNGADAITAVYRGDENFAGATGETQETGGEAPAITSEDSATFTEGYAGSFTVTATGYPAPTLSESGTLPAGVTFDASTGELSGTPTQSGSYPITLEASNGVGTTASQSFTVVVQAAPAFTSEDSTTFTEGESGSYQVSAGGYPLPTLSEMGALPAGVTFDASTGVLSGDPESSGSFQITLKASNAAGFSVQSFTLTVDSPPAITSEPQVTFTTGSAGRFTVSTTGYPAPTVSETGTLPAGVTLNGGVLSGTAAEGGTFPITLTASNEVGKAATQKFTLTVDAAAAITSQDAVTLARILQ